MNLRTHKRRACAGMARRLSWFTRKVGGYQYLHHHNAIPELPRTMIRCDGATGSAQDFLLWLAQCDLWGDEALRAP